MSLFKILAILFLGVAVAGGGTYLVINNKASVEIENGEEETIEEESFTGGVNSLRGLLGLGQSVICSFSRSDEGTEGSTEGTVYAYNGRVRGDFSMEQSGTMFTSHIIIKDEQMYSWTIMPQGTFAQTFSLDTADGVSTNNSGASNEAVSIDDQVEYDCAPWNVDESKFILPVGVDFQDMSATLDASVNAGTGVNGQCGTCAQIPDENAKAQCLAALSCN